MSRSNSPSTVSSPEVAHSVACCQGLPHSHMLSSGSIVNGKTHVSASMSIRIVCLCVRLCVTLGVLMHFASFSGESKLFWATTSLLTSEVWITHATGICDFSLEFYLVIFPPVNGRETSGICFTQIQILSCFSQHIQKMSFCPCLFVRVTKM